MNMTMSPIKIAMMNSIFRLATIMILLPCINLIEKLVFRLIKDDPEDLEEQADFDLLEERFLAYPHLPSDRAIRRSTAWQRRHARTLTVHFHC